MASTKTKFPLPRNFFGEIEFTKEQENSFRERCQEQVKRGLALEQQIVERRKVVDAAVWKPVRSRHTFQLYRHRDGNQVSEADSEPSMLGIGRVEGTIEDAIYGAYDRTDDELRVTSELVEAEFGDGIVLKNIEHGTTTDPYRHMGVKWLLTPFPVRALMQHRDWVLLESTGISKDANGNRYGYHTIHSIDISQCPQFKDVIRGTMYYTFIYRDAGRGMIDVVAQGHFQWFGDAFDSVKVIASSEMLNGVFRYTKAAEAKKLTILALENLERRLAQGKEPLKENEIAPHATCAMCTRHRSSIPFSSRRLRLCKVCDNVVCKSCRVKKNILVGRQRLQMEVSVCQRCIVYAKSMTVNPSDGKYVVSREMQPGQEGNAPVNHANNSQSTQDSTGLPSDDTFTRSAASTSGYSSSSWADDNSLNTFAQLSNEVAKMQIDEDPVPAADPIVLFEGEAIAQPPTKTTAAEPASDSDPIALLAKMMELQQATQRAQELTQASHDMMVENHIGAP